MSGNLKKYSVWVGGFVLLTVATWSLTEVFDEVTKRVGIGPRQLVPESLSRPRTVPAEVRAEKKALSKELETGSIGVPQSVTKEDDALRRQLRAKCLQERAKAISEDEARIATIKVEWDKCLRWARWWPLAVGDANAYCEPWERAKLGVEAGLEVSRGLSCER